MKFKKVFLKNHWANFNQTLHKASLDEGNSTLSNDGLRLFPRENILYIVKNIEDI